MQELPKLNIIEKKSYLDRTKLYNQYALAVLNGEHNVNKYIKLACKRYIDWFDRDDIYFDYDDLDRKIRFISKMKHSTGEFNNKNFELLDFQQWILAGIFGFKWKATGYRVIKNALLFIARKNGKTSISAAIALAHLLCDNEPNAEVACLANSSKQANVLFEQISNYAQSLDPQQKIFKRYRHSIKVPLTKSHVDIHSSDTSSLDGYNLSCGIVDEFGAAKSWDLYNVMKSSQGMRKQPLMIVITTANTLVGEFPLYEMWENCKEILNGNKKDDTQFSALYQLDEGDDWNDETVWEKASPTLGKVVEWQFMREEHQIAVNSPSLEVNFKIKYLNEFCQSAVTWITRETILSHTFKFNFDMFKDDEYYAYAGVDLSTVSDMTAVSYMIVKDGVNYFKTDYYLPSGILKSSKNRELYNKWVKEGYLKLTSGERVDYDYLIKDMLEFDKNIHIVEVYYDKYNAATWKQKCEEEGLILTTFSQTLGAFNIPTKEFERNVFLDNIMIDDNPITRWCFANVELKYDDKNNCKPIKGQGSSNKIDGVIAMLEAYGGWINRELKQGGISVI